MSYWDSTVHLSFNNFTRSENKINMTFRHRKQMRHTSIALCITFTDVTGSPNNLFFVFDLNKYISWFFLNNWYIIKQIHRFLVII